MAPEVSAPVAQPSVEAPKEGIRWVEPADIVRIGAVAALEAFRMAHPDMQGVTTLLEVAIATNKVENMIPPKVERVAGSGIRRAGAIIKQVSHGIDVWVHTKLDEWDETKKKFPVGFGMNRGEMAEDAQQRAQLENTVRAQAKDLRRADRELMQANNNIDWLIKLLQSKDPSLKTRDDAERAVLEFYKAQQTPAEPDKTPQPAPGKK